MPLNQTISDLRCRFQGELFPELANEVGPLGEKHRKLVAALDAAPVEPFAYSLCSVWRGRPPEDRSAPASSFAAKAVRDLPTTRSLIDRIEADPKLRRLCGWSRISQVPSESTFSRAFREFAETDLPGRMHRALVEDACRDAIVGRVSRDSTAIEVREKPAPKPKAEGRPKRRRGRPKKGEERPKEPSRLECRLAKMKAGVKASEMAAELPAARDVGARRNAKGHLVSWTGYKLHIDAADGGIPAGCLPASASPRDSQAAIPLAAATGERVDHPAS